MAQATLPASDRSTRRRRRKSTKAAVKSGYRRFKVDLWATSINDVEIGIYQQSRHRAKSDQFTKDMDVIGQVLEDGSRTGIVAYRMGLWKDKEGVKKRLVLKLFSQDMNWRATMELMVGRSLQLTHGAGGVPVTAYALNLSRTEQVIHVERSANKWPLFPESFSFFLLTDDGPKYYRLRQRLISLGQDYAVYDQQNRKIGYIDGKLVSIGGLWKVKIKAEHDDPRLAMALQLFCTMLRFNKRCRRHVNDLAADLNAGRLEVALESNEQDLYMNPRRMR
ncbi:MAG: hypothetical protein AAF909_08635 [Pseudomonadota bacterium]